MSYENNIWKWLFTLKLGEVIEINTICSPHTQLEFKRNIIEFIRQGLFIPAGFDIEFNDELTKIRKFDVSKFGFVEKSM